MAGKYKRVRKFLRDSGLLTYRLGNALKRAEESEKRRMAKDDEDTGWRTTEGGKHYQINEKGDVIKGPKAMKGTNVNKPSTWNGGASGGSEGSAIQKASSTTNKAKTSKFSKASVSKRDHDALTTYKSAASDPKRLEHFLHGQKPGTMMRDTERGYGVYTKQKDGSWNYNAPGSDTPIPMSEKDVVKELQSGGKAADAIRAIATPKAGDAGRNAFWDAERCVADLKHNAGDDYTGRETNLAEAKKNAQERLSGQDWPKEQGDASAAYTKVETEDGVIRSAGVPVRKLDKGTGVTKIDQKDCLKPNPGMGVFNTLSEFSVRDKNGDLVLTPEREELHQQIISDTFKDASPVPEGQPKVFTMLGGGSAAGKGTIQKMMPALFNADSPVIDADEYKKCIPEYVNTAFSDDYKEAASLAHEESSALAKRAMQAAMANGYNYTLDGTGDGSVPSLEKKIDDARKNGYKVEGVYVTCPTELAVERNAKRSTTDEYHRLVGEDNVRLIHKKVSQMFEQIAPKFDHVVLYDTNQPSGQEPKKIAECYYGEKITVHDQAAYQAFLDKAKEKTD